MAASDILASIVESVTRFSGNKPPDDDMTVIVVKVNGAESPASTAVTES
jgi:serine phosphatase RsbU (regulator of sigma subunit)